MAKKRDTRMTCSENIEQEIGRIVGASKPCSFETVDFNATTRSPTCIEIDLPMVPINELAKVEASSGAAKKPIYLAGKWWARRQPSVFRAILLAAAMKAPRDLSETAKLVWDAYYGNHQKLSAFSQIKVADIFMGGGTTLVEGSRLGMQIFGMDVNPVAWFVVKSELARVEESRVQSLLDEIEAEVKPQIMPHYTCDCPRGHRGKWIQIDTETTMGEGFNPFELTPDQRRGYRYEGPEVVYVFWAKHGPCQVTGCGHRTPIMPSPVMAVKELSVKFWPRECKHCGGNYNIEERDVRMAPGVPLVIAETEHPFAVAELVEGKAGPEPKSAVCPLCRQTETFGLLGKGGKRKVELSLLVHPNWLKGEPNKDPQGRPYGGSAGDDEEATIRWNKARACNCSLFEIRGSLPDTVFLANGAKIKTGNEGGTVPRRSNYSCGSCGTVQDVLETVKASGKTGPVGMYAIHGYCPRCDSEGQPYRGRFFMPVDDSTFFDTALREWNRRKDSDLSSFWPRSELPFGFMTHKLNGGIPNHGFTHWWKMFNPLQLLTHALTLRAIKLSKASWVEKEAVLQIIPQILRANCMFSFWNEAQDCLEPLLGTTNFHPKSTVVSNCVFQKNIGRGTFSAYAETLLESISFQKRPWELVFLDRLPKEITESISGKTYKMNLDDSILPDCCNIECGSSTDLSSQKSSDFDLVITDPPFGGLIHYSELSDFFYVWLRLILKDRYPNEFGPEFTPKTLEAVANPARQPGKDETSGRDLADIFYQRLLTACYKETSRILKPGGLLVFTFHHSEDAPWVSVLESLFDAGFYLVATYPIRSDETKGTGQFGSRLIEYDIIHVCRKRNEDPKPISWPKLRRQVIQDVRALQNLLEHHQKEGLPAADLQVIKRGKALEYYSRHYGKVFKDQDVPMSVLEALIGINQLLDEETGGVKEAPPNNAEPFTRMLLRLFDGKGDLDRDQIQKFLRGSGSAPSDFVDRAWVYEEKKVFYLRAPLEIALEWVGKHRKGMTSDYDQAMFFIGACFEGSGINATETLSNPNFQPHPALGALLTWFKTHGADSQIRSAAVRASMLYSQWESKNQAKVRQLTLFESLGEEAV